jgi:hypothetical protein
MSMKHQQTRGTNAVGFDNAHLMTIDPKEERGKGASVQDAESICLPRLKRQCGILVESDL